MDPILMQQLMMKQGGDSASSDIYEPINSIERENEETGDEEIPIDNNEESFEDSLVSLIRSMHERMTQIGEALPIIESRMTQIEETLPQMLSEIHGLSSELQDIKNEKIIKEMYEKKHLEESIENQPRNSIFNGFGLFSKKPNKSQEIPSNQLLGGANKTTNLKKSNRKKTLSWKYSN
tara:strand:- start:5247 stop:5780 length:534 start_codon:yes stop_codon:yes gene_type:complete